MISNAAYPEFPQEMEPGVSKRTHLKNITKYDLRRLFGEAEVRNVG